MDILTPMQIDKLSRLSIFFIFFYFGLLKVLGFSQAETLVSALHEKTISQLLSKETFFILLGLVECSIGILFLIPRFTKIVMVIFLVQMITTFGPLLLLPEVSWHSFLVPTIVGQYILKNVCLIALSLEIYLRYKNKKIP